MKEYKDLSSEQKAIFLTMEKFYVDSRARDYDFIISLSLLLNKIKGVAKWKTKKENFVNYKERKQSL
jgi:hypothetical protein